MDSMTYTDGVILLLMFAGAFYIYTHPEAFNDYF